MRFKSIFLLIILSFTWIQASENIRLNQVGYYSDAPKYAIAVNCNSDEFSILSADTEELIYTGTVEPSKTWEFSGEQVRLIDFTAVREPGKYVIGVEDLGTSYPFEISDYVHQELARSAIKSYYFTRASTPILEEYGGQWKRPAGHPDTLVYVHPSAATDMRPVNTIISAPKGWYDAGDYNKYIVNSGISTYTILALYEHFSEYFQDFKTNIPESSNTVPDLLDEALWNIRWMLAMQDTSDGGVYHKLTTANFSGAVMPHRTTSKRYVVQKSTPATLNFAAVMAQASRIFRNFNDTFPEFSDSLLNAAVDAWQWARQHPDIRYNQSQMNQQFNPDVYTGEYGDGDFKDEFQWAASELFISTKEDSFLNEHHPLSGWFDVPGWGSVRSLGLYSLVHHRSEIGFAVDTTALKNTLINLGNRFRQEADRSAYRVSIGQSSWHFTWGSNGIAANLGMALIQVFQLTGDSSYVEAALHNLDYLLGRNAVGYCFVTGQGDHSTMNPHHRPSQADGIPEPIPGLLAGGPNPAKQDGCSNYLGDDPANSYSDTWCSYASNENCINWNAPLSYLSGAIEAIYSPTGKSNPTSVQESVCSDFQAYPEFRLKPNYPNPFNPSTTITFDVQRSATIQINIYNTSGQLIKKLSGESYSAGTYQVSWHGDSDAGFQVASGMYIVHLNVQTERTKTTDYQKILLLK